MFKLLAICFTFTPVLFSTFAISFNKRAIAAEEEPCSMERIKVAEGAIRLAQEEIRQGRTGSWPHFIKQRQEFIKTCRAKIDVTGGAEELNPPKPRDKRDVREFEQRVMRAGVTALGMSIFRRVEIRDHNLYLWLRDSSFFGPNLYNFPDFASEFGKWCSCAATTYVGMDLSAFGAEPAIMATFDYYPSTGRSIMRGYGGVQ